MVPDSSATSFNAGEPSVTGRANVGAISPLSLARVLYERSGRFRLGSFALSSLVNSRTPGSADVSTYLVSAECVSVSLSPTEVFID